MIIMIYMDEIFKTITYPGVRKNYYEISNYGTVRNKITKHIKKPFNHKGYLRVALTNIDGSSVSQTNRSVHRLVAYEFCEGYSPNLIVNHIDSDTLNNYEDNLEWVTHKDNSIHGANYGNIKTGINHYLNKFNEILIKDICEKLQLGLSTMDIMHEYGYKTKRSAPDMYKLIDHIKHKRSWKQISAEYNF